MMYIVMLKFVLHLVYNAIFSSVPMTRTRSRSEDRPTLPGPGPLPVGAQPGQWNPASGSHSPVEGYEHKTTESPMLQSFGGTSMHITAVLALHEVIYSCSACIMCSYL